MTFPNAMNLYFHISDVSDERNCRKQNLCSIFSSPPVPPSHLALCPLSVDFPPPLLGSLLSLKEKIGND